MTHTTADDPLSYFTTSEYGDLDWAGTLDFMTRRYIHPLQQHLDISKLVLADCAAGFGWLSFAWLLAGGEHAILIEPNHERLEAARVIAQKLGIEGRCEFRCTTMQNAQLGAKSVDVFASVETLEHVGRANIKDCVATIADCTRLAVLITTPNARFPVIAHDSRLPFAHWLPKAWRKVYAAWFKRSKQEIGNDFLSPRDLAPVINAFKPVARFQTFQTYREFINFYPHYLPYGLAGGRHRHAPSRALRCWIKVVGTLFGVHAWRFSPNLANIWLDPSITPNQFRVNV
jgi:hypothetical protein